MLSSESTLSSLWHLSKCSTDEVPLTQIILLICLGMSCTSSSVSPLITRSLWYLWSVLCTKRTCTNTHTIKTRTRNKKQTTSVNFEKEDSVPTLNTPHQTYLCFSLSRNFNEDAHMMMAQELSLSSARRVMRGLLPTWHLNHMQSWLFSFFPIGDTFKSQDTCRKEGTLVTCLLPDLSVSRRQEREVYRWVAGIFSTNCPVHGGL